MTSSTLYYIHDPMCSWCWGYRPIRDELKASLPAGVKWKNLLGGLAPDSDVPMPEETRAMIKNHWRHIQSRLGTEFNFEFWAAQEPRRSTFPACRAVLVAAEHGKEEEMINAIQRAYYLRAMNPSDKETLLQLAGELGIDADKFGHQLTAAETHAALIAEIGRVRGMGVSSFPSLVLEHGNRLVRIPHDYQSAAATLAAISHAIQASSAQ